MFNVKHCTFYQCRMNGSNSAEESARRPPDLCPVCLRKMQHALGFSPKERYVALAQICESLAAEISDGWPRWESDAEWLWQEADKLSTLQTSLSRKPQPTAEGLPQIMPVDVSTKRVGTPPEASKKRGSTPPSMDRLPERIQLSELPQICYAREVDMPMDSSLASFILRGLSGEK